MKNFKETPNYCDDCEVVIDPSVTLLFHLESEDGELKSVCQDCLATYDKDRVLH